MSTKLSYRVQHRMQSRYSPRQLGRCPYVRVICVRKTNRRAHGTTRTRAVFDWERTAESESQPGFIKNVSEKVKTEAPFIGLLTKLISPQGAGSKELTYSEFSRAIYDNVSSRFHIAAEQLEKDYGEMAGIRGCIYCLWIAVYGTDLVKRSEMLQACKKLRLNSDLEYFIELFGYQRDEALKAYKYLERPTVSLESKIAMAVDALCQLLQVPDDGAIEEADQQNLYQVVGACFPSVSEDVVKDIIAKHPERANL